MASKVSGSKTMRTNAKMAIRRSGTANSTRLALGARRLARHAFHTDTFSRTNHMVGVTVHPTSIELVEEIQHGRRRLLKENFIEYKRY